MKFAVFAALVIVYAEYILCSDVVVPQDPVCSQPLGLENRKIKNSQITTPAEAVASGKSGWNARLNNNEAWCIPNYPGSHDAVFRSDMHIIIDLSIRYKVTAIALQGHKDYGYGPALRIAYEANGLYFAHKVNGDKDILTQQKTGDDYEYLIFKPAIYTSKIKVNLLYDSNPKCLRMELYGCPAIGSSLREYYRGSNENKAILTKSFDDDTLFQQSTFLVMTESFKAIYLLFSKPYAWCIREDRTPLDPYAEWASIDLQKEYLLYALRVDGYKADVDSAESKYLATGFKFEYSLNGKLWASYNGGMEIISSQYTSKNLTFSTPIVARHVRVRMKVNNTALTCMQLQMYGCAALQAKDVTTITPQTTYSDTNLTSRKPTTIALKEARIQFYQIIQGNKYKGVPYTDTLYPDTTSQELDRHLGCLVSKPTQDVSPFLKPNCWIGWNHDLVAKPYIVLTLTYITTVNGLKITTYLNKSAGLSPIKRFVISTWQFLGLSNIYKGSVCSPSNSYLLSPQTYTYNIVLGKSQFQYLKIEMDYSGEWIFMRQIQVVQDEMPAGSLDLSSTVLECELPTLITGPDDDATSTNTIVIIICIIMTFLLILVIACIVYRYRKSLRRVILKGPTPKAIVVHTKYGRDQALLMPDHVSSGRSTPGSFYNDINRNEDVYAAPDACRPSYSEVSIQYAQYTHPDGKSNTYDSSCSKQYAKPDTLPRTNEIYQSSAIYASTYENPYNAVIASTLYSDPAKLSKQKSTVKVFPRSQLTFKERIGVGQFGEVHIAEARGLDEIYGTIGHYNSWGLADTALVAVKMLKSKDEMIAIEFTKEVDVMARLKHENVVRLLGVCDYDATNANSDKLMVVEYMENGDLNQYLRDRRPCKSPAQIRVSQISADVLLIDQLLHMAEQIAAGVKYLHSEGFVHRDLATRNCLVGPALQVKIADFGMSRYLYSKHYYRVEGKAVLPIRWMAPESLFYGKFTQETDVWSFGVTLWEILTFARESPYEHLSDTQVIETACEVVQRDDVLFPILLRPEYCPPEIYAIICKCWEKCPEDRPIFNTLHRHFKEIVNSTEMDV